MLYSRGMDKKVMLNVRIPKSEMQILEAFCDRGGRTKTDVIREFIRGLEAPAEK